MCAIRDLLGEVPTVDGGSTERSQTASRSCHSSGYHRGLGRRLRDRAHENLSLAFRGARYRRTADAERNNDTVDGKDEGIVASRLATDAEVTKWREDGWILVEGLVSTEEIDAAGRGPPQGLSECRGAARRPGGGD